MNSSLNERPSQTTSTEEEISALYHALETEPWSHDFFQTLRRIECLHQLKPRLGMAQRPVDEPLRLGQEPALDFAPAALSTFAQSADGHPPRLLQRFFGLLGPNGPFPLYLTEYARDRLLHAGDRTFARFLDLFHHRFLLMFYRAWAQAQPTVSLDRPQDDRFSIYVGALAGLGSPRLQHRDAVGDHVKYFYAGWFSRQIRNRDGLESLLAGYFRLPVRVEEFVGHWLRLPNAERSRLGAEGSAGSLGVGFVVGKSVWDRQHKFRIHLGPVTLAQYEDFLPCGRTLPRLVALVRQYLSMELEWDVRLVLAQDEVPRLRLAGDGRLGWNSWMGKYMRKQDAADLTLEPEQWTDGVKTWEPQDSRRRYG